MARSRTEAAAPVPLVRFDAAGPHRDFGLTCTVVRANGGLGITYRLVGAIATLSLPTAAASPCRLDGLWRDTCFELFFGAPAGRAYLELNLSPSGDWNAYRFDDHRRGGRPETLVAALPFSVSARPLELEIALQLPLAGLAEAAEELALGPAAVLRSRDGALSHWALRHAGPAPDFHRRDGFLLRR